MPTFCRLAVLIDADIAQPSVIEGRHPTARLDTSAMRVCQPGAVTFQLVVHVPGSIAIRYDHA